MDDIISFVRLKYFPIQPTNEYFNSLPNGIINEIWYRYYGEYEADISDLVRLFNPLTYTYYQKDIDGYVHHSREKFKEFFTKSLEQSLIELHST